MPKPFFSLTNFWKQQLTGFSDKLTVLVPEKSPAGSVIGWPLPDALPTSIWQTVIRRHLTLLGYNQNNRGHPLTEKFRLLVQVHHCKFHHLATYTVAVDECLGAAPDTEIEPGPIAVLELGAAAVGPGPNFERVICSAEWWCLGLPFPPPGARFTRPIARQWPLAFGRNWSWLSF